MNETQFTALLFLLTIGFIIYMTVYSRRRMKQDRQHQTKEQVSVHYQSGWVWDESRQLWVHPKSEKGTTAGTEYRYQGHDLTKEQPPQQTHFHHDDTSFKAPQKPQTKYTTDIPNEDWRTLNDTPRAQPRTAPVPPEFNKSKNSEYQGAYQATPILTKNEFQNYKTLNETAVQKGYFVWSKVRLADLIKPHNTKNYSEYMSRFGKIKSKHVDFVILDQNMKVKAVIELDDKSHDRADRKERDEFVDEILKDCGYKIIHTRYITHNILDNI